MAGEAVGALQGEAHPRIWVVEKKGRYRLRVE